MSDRVHRDRSLPPGYQFGDARWRRPSDTDAEQLARRAQAVPDDAAPRLFLSTLPDPDRWNVIEGEDH